MAAAARVSRIRRIGLRGWLGSFLLITFVLFILIGNLLAASVSDSFMSGSLDQVRSDTATVLQLHAEPVVSPPDLLSTIKPAGSVTEKSFSEKAYSVFRGLPFYYVKFWSPRDQLVWSDRNQEKIGESAANDTALQQAQAGRSSYELYLLGDAEMNGGAIGIDALLDIHVPLYGVGGSGGKPVGVIQVAQDVSELYANLKLGRDRLFFTVMAATVALYYVLVIVVLVTSSTVRRYQRRVQYHEGRMQELRRQFSPAVADAIIALGDSSSVNKRLTARVEASVLFVDIRNFTNQASTMPAEDVVAMLNAYMDTGTRVIFSYDGVVDKFLGDGILAVFGIPNQQPDHALRAAVAALSLRRELTQLNASRAAEGLPLILAGMGIASGSVVAGNIGSASNQLTYTVIGDTVNLASRLVGMAAADEILLTESTVKAAGGKLNVMGGEFVQVRGRDDAVRVYRLLDQPVTPLLAAASGPRPRLDINPTPVLTTADHDAAPTLR